MALFRCGTSSGGGGSLTPVTDWDYKFYSSIGSATTLTFGYKPKRAILTYAANGSRLTKLYDASVDTDHFVSYQENGSKTIQTITDTQWRITSTGFTFAGGYTYTGVVILASPD